MLDNGADLERALVWYDDLKAFGRHLDAMYEEIEGKDTKIERLEKEVAEMNEKMIEKDKVVNEKQEVLTAREEEMGHMVARELKLQKELDETRASDLGRLYQDNKQLRADLTTEKNNFKQAEDKRVR